MALLHLIVITFLSLCVLFTSASNYAIGWKQEGRKAKDYILEVDFDSMVVSPLFPLEIHYINSFGSAFDEAHKIVFLMAETSSNSNKYGFFSIDITTNTTKGYDVPTDWTFSSTLRWISTTPDVVYIFSDEAAYTFSYANSSFELFLNFTSVFENVIPENARIPSPYYFDTNADRLFCYFVYSDSNNEVVLARLGLTMQGEIVEKESISNIPGHTPYFDTTNNNTYSIVQLSQPGDLYNYAQATTENATCSYSKTIFASPLESECYFWDSANNRMLLSNFDFEQGPSICKYTNNVWNIDCQVVAFQLEDIYTGFI